MGFEVNSRDVTAMIVRVIFTPHVVFGAANP